MLAEFKSQCTHVVSSRHDGRQYLFPAAASSASGIGAGPLSSIGLLSSAMHFDAANPYLKTLSIVAFLVYMQVHGK